MSFLLSSFSSLQVSVYLFLSPTFCITLSYDFKAGWLHIYDMHKALKVLYYYTSAMKITYSTQSKNKVICRNELSSVSFIAHIPYIRFIRTKYTKLLFILFSTVSNFDLCITLSFLQSINKQYVWLYRNWCAVCVLVWMKQIYDEYFVKMAVYWNGIGANETNEKKT